MNSRPVQLLFAIFLTLSTASAQDEEAVRKAADDFLASLAISETGLGDFLEALDEIEVGPVFVPPSSFGEMEMGDLRMMDPEHLDVLLLPRKRRGVGGAPTTFLWQVEGFDPKAEKNVVLRILRLELEPLPAQGMPRWAPYLPPRRPVYLAFTTDSLDHQVLLYYVLPATNADEGVEPPPDLEAVPYVYVDGHGRERRYTAHVDRESGRTAVFDDSTGRLAARVVWK